MKNMAKTVRELVAKIPHGTVFALEDVVPKGSTPRNRLSVAKELSKLVHQQRISRVRKGLYYTHWKSSITKNTYTNASSERIVKYYQKKFKNKLYLASFPLHNAMKLTEQVPMVTIIAVEKPPKSFDDERLYFVKSKCAITEKNKRYLVILDCIEDIENVSAKPPGHVADRLMSLYISHLSDKESIELMRYSRFYRPRTRAILASIFATLDKKDFAKQLKHTYNPNSYFEVYCPKSKALSNKEHYGIYDSSVEARERRANRAKQPHIVQ